MDNQHTPLPSQALRDCRTFLQTLQSEDSLLAPRSRKLLWQRLELRLLWLLIHHSDSGPSMWEWETFLTLSDLLRHDRSLPLSLRPDQDLDQAEQHRRSYSEKSQDSGNQ